MDTFSCSQRLPSLVGRSMQNQSRIVRAEFGQSYDDCRLAGKGRASNHYRDLLLQWFVFALPRGASTGPVELKIEA